MKTERAKLKKKNCSREIFCWLVYIRPLSVHWHNRAAYSETRDWAQRTHNNRVSSWTWIVCFGLLSIDHLAGYSKSVLATLCCYFESFLGFATARAWMEREKKSSSKCEFSDKSSSTTEWFIVWGEKGGEEESKSREITLTQFATYWYL